MDRRHFIKSTCTTCIATGGLLSLIASCGTGRYISGKLNNDGLIIDVDDFKTVKNNKTSYLPYLVVRNEELKFPICIYRFSDSDYSALWMQCAHQGAEVQVVGSYLQCPAHGSEYNNRGNVTNGPAERDLRTFPVTIINDKLFVDLRKNEKI